MTDFFFDAHSIWQYVTLVAVIVALVFSFQRTMSPTAGRVYRLSAVAVDIQVSLGIVLWILESGWNLGFMQGWVHPIVAIAALGVLHAFVSRASAAGPEEGNKVFRVGVIIAVVLVLAAIGIAEAA